ncbi:Zinc finger protein RFP, partial [Galemys pyrenaicus]
EETQVSCIYPESESSQNGDPLVQDNCDPTQEIDGSLIFVVNLVLDEATAHPALLLSENGKGVTCRKRSEELSSSPQRFDSFHCVLGQLNITSGRFYWEVDVSNSVSYDIGVCRDDVTKKGMVRISPQNGFWAIRLFKEELWALTFPETSITLREKLNTVGIFLDYKAAVISFYNVTNGYRIHTFLHNTFSDPEQCSLCFPVVACITLTAPTELRGGQLHGKQGCCQPPSPQHISPFRLLLLLLLAGAAVGLSVLSVLSVGPHSSHSSGVLMTPPIYARVQHRCAHLRMPTLECSQHRSASLINAQSLAQVCPLTHTHITLQVPPSGTHGTPLQEWPEVDESPLQLEQAPYEIKENLDRCSAPDTLADIIGALPRSAGQQYVVNSIWTLLLGAHAQVGAPELDTGLNGWHQEDARTNRTNSTNEQQQQKEREEAAERGTGKRRPSTEPRCASPGAMPPPPPTKPMPTSAPTATLAHALHPACNQISVLAPAAVSEISAGSCVCQHPNFSTGDNLHAEVPEPRPRTSSSPSCPDDNRDQPPRWCPRVSGLEALAFASFSGCNAPTSNTTALLPYKKHYHC